MKPHTKLVIFVSALVLLSLALGFGLHALFGDGTGSGETELSDRQTYFQLAEEPVSSLNLTSLQFMANFCMLEGVHGPTTGSNLWVNRAQVYQTQIFNKLLALMLLSG